MSFHVTTLRRLFLFGLLVGLISNPVKAQAPNSPIIFANQDAIVTSFVTAANLGGTSSSSSSDANTQWLKVEIHYSVTPATGDFLDSVEFKIWIEGRDLLDTSSTNPDEGTAIGLTGDVTYVNVPKGKDDYGVFYVHPDTLTRYSTARGYTDFDRQFDIHVQVFVGGALMDEIDKNQGKETDPKWFQALKPIAGLVYRQNQSPFILADSSRYPAIKLPTQ